MTFLSAGVMRAAHRTSFVLLAAAALLTGCGTKDAAGPLIPGAFGRIRFVNLSFDVDTTRGKVNAILESVPFGVDIAYGRSTPAFLPAPATAIYLPILTGSRTLVLRRTADTSATVATFPLTIANGVDYTVYATGASPVTPFITTDTNSTPALGQVRVRVVHLSPAAGNVDVFVTAVGADLSTATPSLANVAYQGTAYLASIAAGTYQVRAVPAGTAPTARAASVSINLASIALTANSARTIIAASNNAGVAPLRFIALTDR